jgi:hypothetical protein
MRRSLFALLFLTLSTVQAGVIYDPPYVYGNFSGSYAGTDGGTVSGSYHIDIDTPGPERTGWAILYMDVFNSYIGLFSWQTAFGSANFDGYSCTVIGNGVRTCYSDAVVPVELGVWLPLDMSLSVSRLPNYGPIEDPFGRPIPPPYAGASVQMIVQIRFFENANGVPGNSVSASLSPEPAPLLTCSGILLWIAWKGRRLQSKKASPPAGILPQTHQIP